MTFIPNEPDVPITQRGEGPLVVRYEDISQTGKLLLDAMPVVLGPSVWRSLWAHESSKAMQAAGIIPVLSRLVLEGGDGPLSVWSNVSGEGLFQLAHTRGPDGSVERLMINMWCNVYGECGRTHGPRPENAGEKLRAARVFAEHVLTRPFGSKDERKVTRLDIPGVAPVPEAVYEWRTPESTLALPEGASWLDETFVVDPAPVVFGLDHTDSNQHVNSLVYPRLFVEAALRRAWDHRKRGALLARAAELAYRKPSFAGERTRVLARAFARGEELGIAAMLVSEEEAAGPIEKAKARCYARLILRED